MPPLPVAVDGALASALLPPPKTAALDASGVGRAVADAARAPSAMTFVPMTNGPPLTTTTNGEKRKTRSKTTERSARSQKNNGETKALAAASASPRTGAGGRGNKGGRGKKK